MIKNITNIKTMIDLDEHFIKLPEFVNTKLGLLYNST